MCAFKQHTAPSRGAVGDDDTTHGSVAAVAVNLMGPFGRKSTERGNRYVLVALDLLTKGVELTAIPDKSAKTVASSLVESVFASSWSPGIHTD